MLPLFVGALIVGTAAGLKLGASSARLQTERAPVGPGGSPPAGAVAVPLPNATQAEPEDSIGTEAPPIAPSVGKAGKRTGVAKRPAASAASELSPTVQSLRTRPDPAAFRRLLSQVRLRATQLEDPARRQEVERLLFLASAAEDLDSLEKAIERLDAAH